MRLSGKVADLAMLDLLQYLHAGEKTGTLILSREEEKAYVYFQKGNIVHAISPQRNTIGDLLLKSKDIDLKTLKKALVLQSEEYTDKAIGQILVEMGAITPERLKEAVIDQIKEAIKHLTGWEEGDFVFEHNEIIPVDDINLNPTSILPISNVNSRGLLLEAAQNLLEKSAPNEGWREKQGPSGNLDRAESSVVEAKAQSVAVTEVPVPSEAVRKPALRICPVLLLTADGIFRNLLRLELLSEGFEVSTPSTLKECLEKADQCTGRGLIPVILSEARMPMERRSGPGTGTHLLRELESRGGSTPVLIMMETLDYEAMRKYYDMGSRAVLPKPARNDTFDMDYPSIIKAFNGVVCALVRRIERTDRIGSEGHGP